jgi:hypothetical protein
VGDVGDRHPQPEAPLRQRLDAHRVVVIAGVQGIDGHQRPPTQIDPPRDLLRQRQGRPLRGLCLDLRREAARQPVAPDHGGGRGADLTGPAQPGRHPRPGRVRLASGPASPLGRRHQLDHLPFLRIPGVGTRHPQQPLAVVPVGSGEGDASAPVEDSDPVIARALDHRQHVGAPLRGSAPGLDRHPVARLRTLGPGDLPARTARVDHQAARAPRGGLEGPLQQPVPVPGTVTTAEALDPSLDLERAQQAPDRLARAAPQAQGGGDRGGRQQRPAPSLQHGQHPLGGERRVLAGAATPRSLPPAASRPAAFTPRHGGAV